LFINLSNKLKSRIQKFLGNNDGTTQSEDDSTIIDSIGILVPVETESIKPFVANNNHDPILREILIDELKSIQEMDFVKSFKIDSTLFDGLKFGMFNLKQHKASQRGIIETVDIIYCDSMNRIYRIDDVYFSKFTNEPIWYYRNKLSKKVRKIQFNKVYNPGEIEKHIVAVRSHYLLTKSEVERVFVYENRKNIHVFKNHSSFGYNWIFKKNEFGFQIISYKDGVKYSYPRVNPEETEITNNPQKQLENKNQFINIEVNQDFDIYKNFFDKEHFTFFFALNGSKVCKIIEEYSVKYQKYRLKNEFNNDPTINIVIKVPKDDLFGIFFFSYIKAKRKVNPIEIYQIDIEEILMGSNGNNETILEELCKKYNCSNSELRDLMIDKYGIANILVKNALFKPKQLKSEYFYIVSKIFFGYFAQRFNYVSNDDFYASDVYKSFRSDFQKTYAEIGKKFQNNAYKSEYSLYKLISYYFDDAVYQYKPSWIKRMSIDIYIPRLLLAIEYQGQQHYESTEFFGKSFEDYSDRISRDTDKGELCQLNGVTLVYWPYSKEINVVELNKMLNDLNYELINFEPSEISYSIELTDYQ
jgi:hypothetical protein